MSRDLHETVPEVLHQEIGGGRWAGEDVTGGVGGGATFWAEGGVREPDGLLVGV